jgi:hypothetical protein
LLKLALRLVLLWFALTVAACDSEGGRSVRLAAAKAPPTKDPPAQSADRAPDVLLAVPSCNPASGVDCYRDTAYGHSINYEPGWVVDADWLVFTEGGDSVEMYQVPDAGEAPKHQAPILSQRLINDGVIAPQLVLDLTGFLGDTVPYSFRIRHVSAQPGASLRATGGRAMLTISSAKETDRFSVVPASLAKSVHDRSTWAVYPRTYRVALVSDSVYEICRIPCLLPDTAKLTPSAKVTKRY